MSSELRVTRRIMLAGPTHGNFDQFHESAVFSNDGGIVPILKGFDHSKLIGQAQFKKSGAEVTVDAHMLFPLPPGFGFSLGGRVLKEETTEAGTIDSVVEIWCIGAITEALIPGPAQVRK